MNRGRLDTCLTLECSPYGARELWLEKAVCATLAQEIQDDWVSTWAAFRPACEAMIQEEDFPDWGTVKMLKGNWELHLFPPEAGEEDVLKDVILSLVFISNGELQDCNWDVHFEDGEVTLCQPSF